MIKNDTLYIGTEARERLIKGIRKCAEAVGSTMGTGGSNALIEAIQSPGHLTTNDGATILQSIKLADPIEEMGRKILLEAVSRANKNSGDGSSTTCVLTAAILEEGIARLDEATPMEIKRSLEACIPLIEESLKKQKRDITVHEVGAVAAISAEDEEIGHKIQEIYEQIGPEGIVYWDISKLPEDSFTIGTGITVNGAGYVSPYMCDLDEATGQLLNQARWKNPRVLLVKQKISSAGEFESLFSAMFNKEIKEVVVFCDEYEPTIIADLFQTRAKRGFKALLVKMPVLWKDQWYEDLAKASGAKIIDPNTGISLKNMTLDALGKFGNITVSKEDTYIDGVNDLTEYCKALDDGSDEAKARIARLNTRTARYFVGAHSDSALSYRRLKVEDAISAAWHALNGGIVAGGGVALANVAESLVSSVDIGKEILISALFAPFSRICSNSNIKFVEHQEELNKSPNLGFDTRTKQIVDMFEAKITDPYTIVLNSCKNAISVAASVLTVNTLVLLPREEENPLMNYPIIP